VRREQKMLPAIVIGIGGTGKWVITDLKKAILEANRGVMPGNIALLAFDLVGQEVPSIERSLFERGKKGKFGLDFEKGDEFTNFSGAWAFPIFEIAQGQGEEWPYIHQWLKKDDAESYHLSREEIHNLSGAGQRRQSSRDSLFLTIGKIYDKLKDAVFTIGGSLPIGADGKPTQRIQVFIVSSIAGGTGCGAFLDFIYLMHQAILDRGREQTPANITAVLVTPRGFEAIVREGSEISMESMEKNCFAAIRELQRHLFNTNLRLTYSDTLQNVGTGGLRILDLCYFIDGTRVGGEPGSRIKHYLGITPAAADHILLHLMEETSPQADNANVIRHIGDFIGRTRGNPTQAPIYSTFGIYRSIFDVDDLIQAFAHRLALDVLGHFLAPSPKGEAEIKSEVQDFLGSEANTPFNRNLVRYLLEHPGAIRPTRDILFRYLEVGVRGEDIALPVLRLDDVPVSTLFARVPMEAVERGAQNRVEANLGREQDESTPKSVGRSYYGVLNYYLKLHSRKFAELLKQEVIRILEEGDRRGALDHAKKFLDFLASSYGTFIKSIEDLYKELNIAEKIRLATQKLAEWKSKNKQKEYLTELKSLTEYRQNDLVMRYVVKIAESHQQFCQNLSTQIGVWIETFKKGKEFVEAAQRQHAEVRIDNRAIKVRGYVTEPEDETERALYQLVFEKAPPADPVKKALYEKLPHPDFGNIIGTFQWRFNDPGEDPNTLCCLLPAEFAPWKELKEKPVEWNYVFVNNFLRLGQFEKLKELSIMDILAFEGKNPEGFAGELERRSLPLADFSPSEQQRGEIGEGGAKVTSDHIQVFAEWNVSPPGKAFADALAERFPNRPPFHDPHQIIRCEMKHFIKIRGFPNLTATETSYRKHYWEVVTKGVKLTPLHNFLADKNAARYEVKLETILKERVRSLNPQVVNLLEDEEMVKAFTLASMFGFLSREYRNGQYLYVYRVSTDGQEKEVKLGEDLVSALETLIFSDELMIQEAKADLKRKVSQQDQEKAKNPTAYAEELKAKYQAMDPGKEETAESDLMRIMKIILWEHAAVFERGKKA